MSGQIAKHIDYVNSVVKTDGVGGMLGGGSKVWQSWIRCVRDYSLDPASRHEVMVVDNAQLTSRQERFSELLSTAKVEMTNLYQQLAGSGFAVLLTDNDGIVRNCVGDPDFTSKASKTGFCAAPCGPNGSKAPTEWAPASWSNARLSFIRVNTFSRDISG